MKKQHALKRRVLSLAVLASAAFLPSASAAIIGHLSVTNCINGGVRVSAASIDWLVETAGAPESSCLQPGTVSPPTNFIRSSLDPTVNLAASFGTINDLLVFSPGFGVSGFMSFGPVQFDLATPDGLGPAASMLSCTPNPAVGVSCSIPGSPFTLTVMAPTIASGGGDVQHTAVSLSAYGTIFDTLDNTTSAWSGAFTTQLNNFNAQQVESTILSGGFIESTYSGEFDVTGVVPEPVSMALIGGGLIALAAIKRRKRA